MQVTIIGGGSYQWTPELVADLLGTECLRGCRLVLEDVDPEPLPKMAALAAKLDEALESKATIDTTTDQRRALEGADFVIVTISTGGFRSMAVDLEVPSRYGIRQAVGDTVGPGGISRALRNVPVLVGIARDMEELCPDAWLLNITNPLTCLTRAACKHSDVKAVGLCHEVGNWCIDLAIALGLPAEAVRPVVAGVNHLPIAVRLDVGGRDGFEVLRELVDDVGGLGALDLRTGHAKGEEFSRLDFAQRHLLALTLLHDWGALPMAGDRHVAEFFPSVLTEASEWGRSSNVQLTTIAQREAHQADYVGDVDAWLGGNRDLQTWQSGELPAPVIDALVTGNHLEVPANVPNAGQCPDVPDGPVVESICVVDESGVHGRDRASAPAAFAELFRRHVAVQEMTVTAAMSGDRALARAAFELDPLAGRGDRVATMAMADEVLAETSEWLPRFSQGSST